MNAKAVVPILVGLTVTGVSAAYLLYLLLKKDEDDLSAISSFHRIKTSRPTVIEVKIPKEFIAIVIGRGGSNIKSIQEKTGTKINFKDEAETEDYRVCVIRGTPESAQLAESLIHDTIMKQPLIETQEMFVPQSACGRIIGKSGENIRSISRASNARVTIEGGASHEIGATRRITIKGSIEQIELAKLMILEKVNEDMEMRGKIQQSLEKRSPRKKLGPQYLMSAEAVEEEHLRRHNTESLLATGKDGFMEVYVSAVEDPGCFWVQVIGPRAVELDHLVEEMTDYYRQDANRELHIIKEITPEQLVAAPYSHDDKWYRCRVKEVKVDDYDAEESQLELYYLDYGDTDTHRKKEVFSLRPDFLKLRYQAIECSLAKVKPRGDAWTTEATDLFEDLCHVAQWRILMARVDSYKERDRGEREGSPIPSIELYDTTGSEDICVAEELVKQEFAVWEKNPEEECASNEKQSTSQAFIKKEQDVTTKALIGQAKSNTIGGTMNKICDRPNIDEIQGSDGLKLNNNKTGFKKVVCVPAGEEDEHTDDDGFME